MKTTPNNKDPKKLGKFITTLREAARLTKEQLAWKAGMHPISLWRIENGLVKRPDQSTLFALAAVLDVHPCRLVFFHQIPQNPMPEGCPLNCL